MSRFVYLIDNYKYIKKQMSGIIYNRYKAKSFDYNERETHRAK